MWHCHFLPPLLLQLVYVSMAHVYACAAACALRLINNYWHLFQHGFILDRSLLPLIQNILIKYLSRFYIELYR